MIGRKIGNYQIVRQLGEGGMGTVYLAEHPGIGKKVAVKMLHPQFCADPEVVSRFFHEARAVNEIGHPNIVDISDFGETPDGVVYFVMELLDGATLRDHLKDAGAMPIERAVEIVRQVADALGAAHEAGIIHRDLKPDNVFLVPGIAGNTEKVKVFDFGVAKLSGNKHSAAHKTAAGSILGTPFYMAPEMIRGRETDGRSDVYALGVVLYEMVAGKLPFAEELLVDLLAAVVKQAAAPPSSHQPSVPPWVDAFILRCLEKDPDRRPQTMAEFAQGLSRGVTSVPTPLPGAPDLEFATSATLAVSAAQVGLARHSGQLPSVSSAQALRQLTGAIPTSAAAYAAGRSGTALRMVSETGRLAAISDRTRWAISGVGALVLALIAWTLLSRSSEKPAAFAEIEVLLNINSTPQGALVVRMPEGRSLGTTPVRDFLLTQQAVEYHLKRDGFVEVQRSFEATSGGEQTITITLSPVPVHHVAPVTGGATPENTVISRLSTSIRRRSKAPVLPLPPPPVPAARAPTASPAQTWGHATAASRIAAPPAGPQGRTSLYLPLPPASSQGPGSRAIGAGSAPAAQDENLPPLGERTTVKRLGRH